MAVHLRHFDVADNAGIFLRLTEDGFQELLWVVVGIDVVMAVPEHSLKNFQPFVFVINNGDRPLGRFDTRGSTVVGLICFVHSGAPLFIESRSYHK